MPSQYVLQYKLQGFPIGCHLHREMSLGYIPIQYLHISLTFIL